MFRYLTLFVMLSLLVPSLLLAQEVVVEPTAEVEVLKLDTPITNPIFSDGTIDLRVLTLGKKTSVDIVVAGIGFRVDPENWAQIDFDPTFVDVGLILCTTPYFNTVFQTNCD